MSYWHWFLKWPPLYYFSPPAPWKKEQESLQGILFMNALKNKTKGKNPDLHGIVKRGTRLRPLQEVSLSLVNRKASEKTSCSRKLNNLKEALMWFRAIKPPLLWSWADWDLQKCTLKTQKAQSPRKSTKPETRCYHSYTSKNRRITSLFLNTSNNKTFYCTTSFCL